MNQTARRQQQQQEINFVLQHMVIFFTLFLHSVTDVHHSCSHPQWAQNKCVNAVFAVFLAVTQKALRASHRHVCNPACGLVLLSNFQEFIIWKQIPCPGMLEKQY